MRRFLLFLPIILLFTCSWVDRSTIDTYYGTIYYVDSSYDVTRLSGSIEFYLTDYVNLALTDSGYLLNGSSNTLKGVALINGSEYPIQFSSNGELQIQQEYLSNTNWRTTWVNYHLLPERVPSNFSFSELAPILILFTVFIIVPLSFLRGALL